MSREERGMIRGSLALVDNWPLVIVTVNSAGYRLTIFSRSFEISVSTPGTMVRDTRIDLTMARSTVSIRKYFMAGPNLPLGTSL